MGKCVIQQFQPRALEQQRLSHWIKGSFLFLCVVALRPNVSQQNPASIFTAATDAEESVLHIQTMRGPLKQRPQLIIKES